MAVTDTRTVAGILFAETDELRALPGKDAELANLRAALAEQIIASDNGVGFKQPAIPTNADLADTNIRAVWDACVAAANAAIGRDPAQSGAVFIDDQDPTKDRARLSEYPWLARKNPKVFGEADWRGIPVKLYVVDVTGVAPGR